MAVTFAFDEELGRRIARALRAFPDNFSHIKHQDVLPIRVSGVLHPDKYAEVRKIPAYVVAGMVKHPFKVSMLVYDSLYYDLPKRVQSLVVVHELEHIQPHHLFAGEYVLKHHDVQDWASMVLVLGHDWQNRLGSFQFDIFKTGETDWSKVTKQLAKTLRKRSK